MVTLVMHHRFSRLLTSQNCNANTVPDTGFFVSKYHVCRCSLALRLSTDERDIAEVGSDKSAQLVVRDVRASINHETDWTELWASIPESPIVSLIRIASHGRALSFVAVTHHDTSSAESCNEQYMNMFTTHPPTQMQNLCNHSQSEYSI
jgi:hypothetical protein